jgi:hypothetical protein
MSQQSPKPRQDQGEFPLKYLYVSIILVLLFMSFFYFATH